MKARAGDRERELINSGSTVLNGGLDRGKCKNLASTIAREVQILLDPSESDENAAIADIFVGSRGPSKRSLEVEHERAIVHLRLDNDVGMVDVAHPAKLWPELELLVQQTVRQVRTEMPNFCEKHHHTRTNLYVNQNVTETRSWHFDSWRPTHKVFVYLTDVRDSGDGPYRYILGSQRKHLNRMLRMIQNRRLGLDLRDAPDPDYSMESEILGPAGTIFISNQAGYHRGTPQTPGRHRLALVLRYEVR